MFCASLVQLCSPALANELQSTALGAKPLLTSKPESVKVEPVLDIEIEEDEPEEPNAMGTGHGLFVEKQYLQSKKIGKPFTLTLEQNTVLVGSVTSADGDPLVNQQMNGLIKSALAKNERLKAAEKAYTHFNSAASKAAVKSKDAINIIVPYRGFASSSEAGDIIMDEKLKLQSLAAAELAKQKEQDETQMQVSNHLMEMAMALGTNDEAKQLKVLMRAHKKLVDLVGIDDAQEAVNKLSLWKRKLNTPEGIFERELWDPGEQSEKLEKLVQAAAKRDPVMNKIDKAVHKYNKKSKGAMLAGRVIEGTLGAACLVPSFVGPGAQIALTTFEMATGGSEENKLLKQIYLGKRRESRLNLLHRKAELALHNYQIGKASRNVVLMGIAESMIDEMAGQSTSHEVLGADIL